MGVCSSLMNIVRKKAEFVAAGVRAAASLVRYAEDSMSANTVTPVASVSALDAIQLTRRLIDIESITYNECAVGVFLAEFLESRGFAVEKIQVEQDKESRCQGERFNVYAQMPGATPKVVFSTHMDTVPPFIASSEDEEFIYGRGAC